VTGPHVREFFLAEDRTLLIMVSFVPGGLRSDRIDVAPIVDRVPPPARDAVRIVDVPGLVTAYTEDGADRPILSCSSGLRCSVLALSPIRRLVYFAANLDGASHTSLLAAEY
jgi:hypothetical protein